MDALIEKARAVALDALKDETRYDGTPFMQHPDNVARIVADEIGLPMECVAAVYLHEATRMHKEVDISSFPKDVRKIAEGLNKISTIKPKDTRLEAENYKKLIVQYSTDPRVVVLKIADRLEVMRSLNIFPKASREQKLLETMMLYMPLAHQLGLYNINNELGNIYFRYSEPEQYRAVTNKLKATEKDREQLTAEFIRPLEKKLSDAGIRYKLKARTKSAYSIYRKMQVQKVPFEGVYDVFAIRFIIDCEDDPKVEKDLCWKVYSYVTEEYEPDIKRLRDWLTTPRPNGYESLHITVKNKQGKSLEVQIRTKRMDIEAATRPTGPTRAYATRRPSTGGCSPCAIRSPIRSTPARRTCRPRRTGRYLCSPRPGSSASCRQVRPCWISPSTFTPMWGAAAPEARSTANRCRSRINSRPETWWRL